MLAGVSALVPAPAHREQAGVARPVVALSVSPAHLTLAPPGARRIRVRNDGVRPLLVEVTRRVLGLDAAVGTSLRIAPAHLLLRAGQSSLVTLRVARPRRTEPGEHQALILLTTRRQRAAGGLDAHLRLGVRVRMVVPGRVVRDLRLGAHRVRRKRGAWIISFPATNRGNVTVRLRANITALLPRRGRPAIRMRRRVEPTLRPGARTWLMFRCTGRVHGQVTAIVRVRLAVGVPVVERRYRIRLPGGFG